MDPKWSPQLPLIDLSPFPSGGYFWPSEVRFRGILALSRDWFYNGKKQKCKFLKKGSLPDFKIFGGDSWGNFTKNGTNLRPGQFFFGFDPYKSLWRQNTHLKKDFHLDCRHHYLQSHQSHFSQNHTQYKIYIRFPTLHVWMKNSLFAKGHLHRSHLYLPKGVTSHMATGCWQSFAQLLPVLTALL